MFNIKLIYVFVINCLWYRAQSRPNLKLKQPTEDEIMNPRPPKDNSHYIESVSQEIWMPLMNDEMELVTLETNNSGYSRFFLSKSIRGGIYVDKELYLTAQYHDEYNELFDKPTLIITHDWRQNVSTKSCQSIRAKTIETTETDKGNIVFYDWSNVAMNESYPRAVTMVKEMAEELVNFIEFFGLPIELLHMVGHGVGAHILGNAGRLIAVRTGKRVSRITGLDPAGPLFYNNTDSIIMYDAKYVEIIHTDMLKLGMYDTNLGHAQFLVNGGRAVQPGCKHPACSHRRAYKYFVRTFDTNQYFGAQCPPNFHLVGPCYGTEYKMGGIAINKRATWTPVNSFFWVIIRDENI